VSGIRSFIQNELQDGRELYRNIRDLRNSIAHSTKPLKEILALSAQYTPKTGEALFRAICYILGYPDWQTVAHEAILREFPIRGEIQGILIGGDSASLGQDGQDPYLEIHHRLTGSRINEATEAVDYDGETTFTARFASNVSLKSPEIRFYGDSQTAGTMRGKTLRTANGKETQI